MLALRSRALDRPLRPLAAFAPPLPASVAPPESLRPPRRAAHRGRFWCGVAAPAPAAVAPAEGRGLSLQRKEILTKQAHPHKKERPRPWQFPELLLGQAPGVAALQFCLGAKAGVAASIGLFGLPGTGFAGVAKGMKRVCDHV